MIENAFNEIHFLHCITHPPARKHSHTVSVLSWAPRIPSSASGYLLLLVLEVTSFIWLKDYCGPIHNLSIYFPVFVHLVNLFIDISWWFPGPLNPRGSQKCSFSGSTHTHHVKLWGWRPVICAFTLSSDAHTHTPDTTCTKPSGDVTAVPVHESLGTVEASVYLPSQLVSMSLEGRDCFLFVSCSQLGMA